MHMSCAALHLSKVIHCRAIRCAPSFCALPSPAEPTGGGVASIARLPADGNTCGNPGKSRQRGHAFQPTRCTLQQTPPVTERPTNAILTPALRSVERVLARHEACAPANKTAARTHPCNLRRMLCSSSKCCASWHLELAAMHGSK